MSAAPDRCLYCDGTNPNCGFCEMGVPLDTQADWDASWGRIAKYESFGWGFGPGLLHCLTCGAVVFPEPKGPDRHGAWHREQRR